jgi:hypothetical protein
MFFLHWNTCPWVAAAQGQEACLSLVSDICPIVKACLGFKRKQEDLCVQGIREHVIQFKFEVFYVRSEFLVAQPSFCGPLMFRRSLLAP